MRRGGADDGLALVPTDRRWLTLLYQRVILWRPSGALVTERDRHPRRVEATSSSGSGIHAGGGDELAQQVLQHRDLPVEQRASL